MKHYVTLLASLLIAGRATAQQYEFSDNSRNTINVESKADNANPSGIERINLHFQATYIYQYKPDFAAKYTGPNSLSPLEAHENSLTATMFAGLRLWKGAEIYINPVS